MNATSDSAARNPKRLMFFSALIASMAVVIYLFAVQPCQMSLDKVKRELADLTNQQRDMENNLKRAPGLKKELAEVAKASEPFLEALLKPQFGTSWALSANAILNPIAADVGLQVPDEAYSELPARALPVPKVAGQQLSARQPIRVSCRGSYAEIASFILRVEKLLPFVSLQALQIKPQKDHDVQAAEIVFEWLVKRDLPVPVPPPTGGAKK